VKAYLKRSKNDANDAAAICEAVTRPSMRFVALKTKEQQASSISSSRRPRRVRRVGLHHCSPHLGQGDQTGRLVAPSIFLTSKFRPQARTLQAMRASLLARAIASTLRCSRFLAASIQGLSPWRSQLT
jgi:transposase